MEERSVWERFWSRSDWLDRIDVVTYGGLGLSLLGYLIWSANESPLDARNRGGSLVLVVVLLLSVISLARDLRRKLLSMPSRLLVGAWALCVGLVVAAELLF